MTNYEGIPTAVTAPDENIAVDVLVNNAGCSTKALEDTSMDDLQRQFVSDMFGLPDRGCAAQREETLRFAEIVCLPIARHISEPNRVTPYCN
ncbi:MAG: hypothetical protein ABW043_01700 [Devosia sp.]|uniref:hypothetical protein n=1 Tax=Devosia sp. TaxID=1871048 RepID=UPI003396B683